MDTTTAQKDLLEPLYCNGIIATNDLSSFELVKPGEVHDEDRKADSTRRGMCRFVGMLIYLRGGYTLFELDVPISECDRQILEFVFLNRLRDMGSAWCARQADATDWLSKLYSLEDHRTEN